MTTKNLYPNSVPSLDLNFAKLKRLDPRVTFTRTSTGTYVGADGLIKTAGNGVARFDHNPATGESLGLLVEEARTNNLLRSEEFDNATWIKETGISITATAGLAPNGTATAETATHSSADGALVQNTSVGAGIHSFSVYLKYIDTPWVRVTVGNTSISATAYFNLSTGALGALGNNASSKSYSIQALPNGWYRCTVTGALTTDGTNYVQLNTAPADANGSRVIGSFYAWGAQLETGAFPTSYIPTTTATVTRAADIASITGTNFSSWYNVNQGTLFAALRLINTSQGGVIGPINSSNVDINEGLVIQAYTAQLRALNYLDSGSTNNDIVNNTPAIGVNKIAVAGSTTDDATGVYFNALTGLVNASRAQGFSNVAGLKIGERGGQRLNGTIARLAYYPVRLPDAQLQALTAT
jgi:hypothetical protein